MDKSNDHTNNELIMKIDQEVYYGDKKKVFCPEKEIGNYHGGEGYSHEASEEMN